ncbi:MFS family permease [Arthrobacter sp. B3I4]|nr:MFS family permease [Arthrobacter sp. B3I4]
MVVAFFIRRTLHEPPAFEEAQKSAQISKLPVADLLKHHWRDVLRVVACAFIAAVSTVFGTLAISYAKNVANVDGTVTLWLVVGANLVALGTQPLFGKLADRIGRKPVFIYGALSSAVLTPVFLLSLESGSVVLMFLAAIGFFSFGYAASNAVWPSFYAEMFSTKVRFSGLAIGTQLGFLMAGFAPAIVAAMGGIKPGGWVQITIFTGIICVIAAVSAMTAKETFKVPTRELGLR